MIQHAGEPTAKTESTTEKSIEEYQLEAYNGRRRGSLSIALKTKVQKAEVPSTEGTQGFNGTPPRSAMAWQTCLLTGSFNQTGSSFLTGKH